MIIIAGPCQIEDPVMMEELAQQLLEIICTAGFHPNDFYFKSSFDKANRTHVKGPRGPGIDAGLNVLFNIKDKFGIQTLTDVHDCWQVGAVEDVVDVIQIPAMLCRQTDLVIEAAKSRRYVNIKKGQFLAPWDVEGILSKVRSIDDAIVKTWITERGTCFGYNRLVVDFTGIHDMREVFETPIIFDGTHSVQRPSADGFSTGGDRKYVEGLCRAAIAQGIDGLFLEVHPRPDCAPSDGATMITPDIFERIMTFAGEIK